jgi:hypothetical protein
VIIPEPAILMQANQQERANPDDGIIGFLHEKVGLGLESVFGGPKAFERPWQAVMLALEGKKKELGEIL